MPVRGGEFRCAERLLHLQLGGDPSDHVVFVDLLADASVAAPVCEETLARAVPLPTRAHRPRASFPAALASIRRLWQLPRPAHLLRAQQPLQARLTHVDLTQVVRILLPPWRVRPEGRGAVGGEELAPLTHEAAGEERGADAVLGGRQVAEGQRLGL